MELKTDRQTKKMGFKERILPKAPRVKRSFLAGEQRDAR